MWGAGRGLGPEGGQREAPRTGISPPAARSARHVLPCRGAEGRQVQGLGAAGARPRGPRRQRLTAAAGLGCAAGGRVASRRAMRRWTLRRPRASRWVPAAWFVGAAASFVGAATVVGGVWEGRGRAGAQG